MAQLQQHQQLAGNQQPQQLQQNALSSQLSQNSNHHLHQQESAGGSVIADGSMSNSFQGNDQGGRKRKQPVSSSGPANSSGTANTAGPSPSSAPSTPSTHTPGDVISMPSLPPSAISSKPFIFNSDVAGTLTSPTNHPWESKELELQADMGYVDDDNVDTYLSHDDNDPMDVNKASFTFNEVCSIQASTSKVVSCHFSSDGKLLASGGHDKKDVLWYADSLTPKSTLEEHSKLITDVRFSPSILRLATSSFDKTVRVWDADNEELLSGGHGLMVNGYRPVINSLAKGLDIRLNHRLTFLIAEACLIAGATKNAYHTKYRSLIYAENFSYESLRKGVFIAGAVFVVATMILNVYSICTSARQHLSLLGKQVIPTQLSV